MTSALETLPSGHSESEVDDDQTVHIIEVCIVCYFESHKWYSSNKEYLTLCGRYESNPEDYLDMSKIADCVDCIIAIPTNICVICGEEIK